MKYNAVKYMLGSTKKYYMFVTEILLGFRQFLG